jgi:hypothetical protein
MSTLRTQDLKVESFEVVSAGGVTPIDTQQMDCWSPLCMYSEQRTCPEKCPAAAEEGVEAEIDG